MDVVFAMYLRSVLYRRPETAISDAPGLGLRTSDKERQDEDDAYEAGSFQPSASARVLIAAAQWKNLQSARSRMVLMLKASLSFSASPGETPSSASTGASRISENDLVS